jgi:hypothetical protein
MLYDSRLTNHIATDAIMVWKNYESAGNDSKFTDLKSVDERCLQKEKQLVKIEVFV